MEETWIRIVGGHSGGSRGISILTREQAVSQLLKPAKVKIGVFSESDEDLGDVVLVKRAVAYCGGIRQLAHVLKVDRTAVYQWVRRNSVPKRYRGAVTDMAREYLREEMGE